MVKVRRMESKGERTGKASKERRDQEEINEGNGPERQQVTEGDWEGASEGKGLEEIKRRILCFLLTEKGARRAQAKEGDWEGASEEIGL